MEAAVLLGTVSRDRYLDSGRELPGGGILNVAWHWRRVGRPFTLLTRLGSRDAAPALAFLDRNDIPYLPQTVVAPGRSSSIDIVIEADRQPHMDRFVPGVWSDVRLAPSELIVLERASRLHVVLVEGAIDELGRLAAVGRLDGKSVAADFLGFRHYTVERFGATMGHVDVAFVGWPGAADDPVVAGIRSVAFERGRLVVVTMGARSVRIFDGRDGAARDIAIAVSPVPVAGTTLGCGDAFIAGFLDAFWTDGDVHDAVERGKMAGAAATAWTGPLPDDAYESPPRRIPT